MSDKISLVLGLVLRRFFLLNGVEKCFLSIISLNLKMRLFFTSSQKLVYSYPLIHIDFLDEVYGSS